MGVGSGSGGSGVKGNANANEQRPQQPAGPLPSLPFPSPPINPPPRCWLPRPLSADAADAHPLHAAANRQMLFPRPGLTCHGRACLARDPLHPFPLFFSRQLFRYPPRFAGKGACIFFRKGTKCSRWTCNLSHLLCGRTRPI